METIKSISNFNKRFKQYKCLSAVKQQKLLYKSLSKYGYLNHLFEVICELPNDITQEILDNYEKLYILLYKNCNKKLLNLTDGGLGSSGKRLFNITKQELTDLYINKNYTKLEISKIIGCKERLIKKYLKDYNIKKDKTLELERARNNYVNIYKGIKLEKEILDLINLNKPHKEIISILNITNMMITRVKNKYNIIKKQKFKFNKILDLSDNNVYNLKEICNKYEIKQSTLKEQFRNNRLKYNLKLI